MYRTIDQDAVDYAGEPSPAVDEAWAKLIDGEQRSNKFRATTANLGQADIQGFTKRNIKVSARTSHSQTPTRERFRWGNDPFYIVFHSR